MSDPIQAFTTVVEEAIYDAAEYVGRRSQTEALASIQAAAADLIESLIGESADIVWEIEQNIKNGMDSRMIAEAAFKSEGYNLAKSELRQKIAELRGTDVTE